VNQPEPDSTTRNSVGQSVAVRQLEVVVASAVLGFFSKWGFAPAREWNAGRTTSIGYGDSSVRGNVPQKQYLQRKWGVVIMDMYEGNLTNTMEELVEIGCRCLRDNEVVYSEHVRDQLVDVSIDNSFQWWKESDLTNRLEEQIHSRCPHLALNRGAEIRLIAEEMMRVLDEVHHPGGQS
jgi:hypothetical protein